MKTIVISIIFLLFSTNLFSQNLFDIGLQYQPKTTFIHRSNISITSTYMGLDNSGGKLLYVWNNSIGLVGYYNRWKSFSLETGFFYEEFNIPLKVSSILLSHNLNIEYPVISLWAFRVPLILNYNLFSKDKISHSIGFGLNCTFGIGNSISNDQMYTFTAPIKYGNDSMYFFHGFFSNPHVVNWGLITKYSLNYKLSGNLKLVVSTGLNLGLNEQYAGGVVFTWNQQKQHGNTSFFSNGDGFNMSIAMCYKIVNWKKVSKAPTLNKVW